MKELHQKTLSVDRTSLIPDALLDLEAWPGAYVQMSLEALRARRPLWNHRPRPARRWSNEHWLCALWAYRAFDVAGIYSSWAPNMQPEGPERTVLFQDVSKGCMVI